MVALSFFLESTANKTAKELDVNYRTILTRFNNFRRQIAAYQQENFRLLRGEIECDESYFGGRRKYLKNFKFFSQIKRFVFRNGKEIKKFEGLISINRRSKLNEKL